MAPTIFRFSRQLIRRRLPVVKISKMRFMATAASVKEAESSYKIIDKAVDFEKAQTTRPEFDHSRTIEVTKHPNPEWTYGQGVETHDASIQHREIDPYASNRPMVNNYRLLVAGIAPRPVGFVSTVSGDGKSKNLSPFSYFQVIDHDPPMFIIGFSSRPGREKDTYRNLKDTGECVINSVSENMIEAVNASSIDAPYGVSEWDVSGLHEAGTTTVKPSRVQESVFSIEAKVVDIKEFASSSEGMSLAGLVLLKATRFWVREDATNSDASHIDLEKLRPVGQLGGISYSRIISTFELPRRRWEDEYPKSELLASLASRKSNNSVDEDTTKLSGQGAD
ncbi:FMN-binding split barrel [Metarhizium brunneum]